MLLEVSPYHITQDGPGSIEMIFFIVFCVIAFLLRKNRYWYWMWYCLMSIIIAVGIILTAEKVKKWWQK
jgi:peptidoglycan/LPS O-acetylase OafA/YrhL